MYITKIQVVYLVKELMDALNRTSSSVSLLYRKISVDHDFITITITKAIIIIIIIIIIIVIVIAILIIIIIIIIIIIMIMIIILIMIMITITIMIMMMMMIIITIIIIIIIIMDGSLREIRDDKYVGAKKLRILKVIKSILNLILYLTCNQSTCSLYLFHDYFRDIDRMYE